MWLSLVFFKGPKHFISVSLFDCILPGTQQSWGWRYELPSSPRSSSQAFLQYLLENTKEREDEKIWGFFLKRDKTKQKTKNKKKQTPWTNKKKPKPRQKLYDFFFTRAKLRASVNPAAARSCLSSSVSLLSGNCEQIHKNAHAWLDTLDCLINSAFAYSNAPCIENKQRQLPGWLQCRCVGWCG